MKKYSMYSVALSAVFAGFSNLWGAGFQIIEQGAANMGTAMAGATANANGDASAAYWNPSAAFFADLDVGETLLSNTVSVIVPRLSFANDNSTNYLGETGLSDNNISPVCPVPNFYAIHKFTDDIIGTFSFTAPYGLESRYADSWVGRYQGVHSFLFTMDFNPSIAYRVNDWLTIGGGVSAQYMYVKLSSFYPVTNWKMKLTGDGWGVGGNLGFTVNYMDEGRFAFAWRSSVFQDLAGNAHRNGDVWKPIEAQMNTPHTFTVSWYQRLQGDLKNFALMAEYAYTTWSMFEDLTVTTNGAPFSSEVENWRDTSRVAMGMHYYPDFLEDVVFRIGATYDQTPVKNAEYRTVRIPCVDRVWLAAGLGYEYSENISFDFTYMYIFLVGDGDIRHQQSAGGMPISYVGGDYYGHIQVFSMQVNYKF